jgi:hypothetical protein
MARGHLAQSTFLLLRLVDAVFWAVYNQSQPPVHAPLRSVLDIIHM